MSIPAGAASSSPRPSPPIEMLSVGAGAAIRTVGLKPVGQVSGTCIRQLSWINWTGCGIAATAGNARNTFRVSPPIGTYRQYEAGVRQGYQLALDRLRHQVDALGAAGAIDVRLTVREVTDDCREY